MVQPRSLNLAARRFSCGCILAAAVAGPLSAQQDVSTTATSHGGWGTSNAPTAAEVQPETSLTTAIRATSVFTAAGYGSGGVSLRNRGGGNIAVSGVVTPAKAAYLYWAVISEGAAPKAAQSLKIQRLSPTEDSTVATVTGKSLGTAASPCWPGNTITVFKGTVPLSVANGNGSYQITLLAGASGSTAGADPWLSHTLPLFEGASLAIVGKGSGTVAFYDEGLAAHTFFSYPGLTYTLTLPAAAPGKSALFDNIGADGQHGVSRTAELALSEKFTLINSVYVGGPASVYLDSDWSGSSGLPLPQLWDDTGHDISSAVPKGTKTLSVDFFSADSGGYDCLTTTANIVQIE